MLYKIIMEERISALVVDDEKDVCFLLSSILKNREVETTCVNSIAEARLALTVDDPSIIFLDNHLPDGYGINFIEEIRNEKPRIKIVMITAHDTESDKSAAYREGAHYFIGKPFTRDIILNAVENLVKLQV